MSAENNLKSAVAADASTICIRTACLDDAPQIWRLVVESGALDVNSRYCYLLMCSDFADTCLVACRGDEIVGFVMAYRPPRRLASLFVWQIGIAKTARGQGLATRLLRSLMDVPGCDAVKFIEATVTPSNRASRRLFQAFANELEVECAVEKRFTADMFDTADHEEEQLYRIGPLAESSQEKSTI